MNLRKKGAIFKKVAIAVALTAVVFPVQAAFAKDKAFVSYVIDTDSLDVKSTVNITGNSMEDKIMGCPIIENGLIYQVQPDGGGPKASRCVLKLPTGTTQSMGELTLFSFPNGNYNPNGYDIQFANWVGTQLAEGLNTTLSVIESNNSKKLISKGDDLKLVLTNLNDCVNANLGSTASFTCLNTEMKWATAENEVYKRAKVSLDTGYNIGSKPSNYLIIKQASKDVLVRYAVPSGYKPGQYLYDLNAHGEVESNGAVYEAFLPEYLNWNYVIDNALSHYKKKVTFQDISIISQSNDLQNGFTDLLQSMVNGVNSMLGLYSIEDIMLNTGERGAVYYKGLFPYSWFSSLNVIFWMSNVMAILFVAVSIIKNLARRSVATFNTNIRASLKEDLLSYGYVALMLVLFIPAFYLLVTFNEMLVNTFASMIEPGAKLSPSMSGNALYGILAACIYLFVCLKINITYIIRAVILAFLYALAPIFISFILLGQKAKSLFQNWLQELMTNIFMQTFNAIVLVVFILVIGVGTRGIERIVLLYSFIPLNDFFKRSLMGGASGGDGAMGMGSAAFGGAAVGLLGMAAGGAAALAGNGEIAKAFGGDKRAMEGSSLRADGAGATGRAGSFVNTRQEQINNAKIEKGQVDAGPQDKHGNAKMSKSDIQAAKFNKEKNMTLATDVASSKAKAQGPFSAARLAKESSYALGSAAVAATSLGLSFGAGAAGYNGKMFGMAGAAATFNALQNTKDAIGEGRDFYSQQQIIDNQPADAVQTYLTKDDDAENMSEWDLVEDDDGDYIMCRFDDDLVNDFTDAKYDERWGDKRNKELPTPPFSAVRNEQGHVAGLKFEGFKGNFTKTDGYTKFTQTENQIYHPREVLGDAVMQNAQQIKLNRMSAERTQGSRPQGFNSNYGNQRPNFSETKVSEGD